MIDENDLRTPILTAKWPVLPLAQLRGPWTGTFGRLRDTFIRASAADERQPTATPDDAYALDFITSVVSKRKNRGELLTAPVEVATGGILALVGRPAGGANYKALARSIHRLANTQVHITTAGGADRTFRLLDLPTTPGTIAVPAWLVEEVLHNRIVKIEPAALVKKGIDRMLYNWSTAHALNASSGVWKISLHQAYKKSGSRDAPRKFFYRLKAAAGRTATARVRATIEGTARRQFLVLTQARYADGLVAWLDVPPSPLACNTVELSAHLELPADETPPPTELFFDFRNIGN